MQLQHTMLTLRTLSVRRVLFGLLIAALTLGWGSPAPANAHTAAPEAPQPPQPDMLKYSHAGHVLAFAPGQVYLVGMDHALSVEFLAPQSVTPLGVAAGSPVGEDTSQAPPLGSVTYTGLWPSIELRYQAAPSGLVQSEYHLAPGADPAHIRLRFNTPVHIAENGGLRFDFPSGQMTASAPLAWQEVNGQRLPVEVAFQLIDSPSTLTFSLGAYDPAYPLTIDPTYTWHTFYGAQAMDDTAFDVVVDGSGNILVVGDSEASWNGPSAQAPLNAHAGGSGYDIMLLKLDSAGAYQWHTFYGSTSDDFGYDVALNASGDIFVMGESEATWGSPLNAHAGSYDIVVLKLDSAGAYQWHTFHGSSSSDTGNALALDGSGSIFATGYSRATWNGPASQAPLNAHAGGSNHDIVVLNLDSTGAYQWHTFYGSTSVDLGISAALDGNGAVFLVGVSKATWNGPTSQAPLNAHAGGSDHDIVVLKLDSAGAYQWHTFYGSTSYDFGYGMALNNSGDIFVTGESEVTWGAPLNAHAGGGNTDILVLKLDSAGAYQWHTFYGTTAEDAARIVALDGGGDILLAGVSEASWNGPAGQAPRNAFTGASDITLLKLDSAGAYQWHTFYGQAFHDIGNSVALDGSGGIIVTGDSQATWNGPASQAPLNAHAGGSDYDIAVLKLSEDTLDDGADDAQPAFKIGAAGGVFTSGPVKVLFPQLRLSIFEVAAPTSGDNVRLGTDGRVFDIIMRDYTGRLVTDFGFPLAVCIRPTAAEISAAGGNIHLLNIFHKHAGGNWDVLQSYVDGNYVCATVKKLSLFGLGIPLMPATGYAPDAHTSLPEQPPNKAYFDLSSGESLDLRAPATHASYFGLEIPSLGVQLPIVGVPLTQDGWDVAWLGHSAGWLQGTAFPTWAGNTAITTHVWDANNHPGPFVDLHTLQHGDEIIIRAFGQRHVYQVRQVTHVPPDDLRALPHEEVDVLTLITCKGYDESHGEYDWRLAVRAVLMEVQTDYE